MNVTCVTRIGTPKQSSCFLAVHAGAPACVPNQRKSESAQGESRNSMGIVGLALRQPYTVIVMGLLIAVLGILSVLTMSTDIFPDINVPVISVVWTDVGI